MRRIWNDLGSVFSFFILLIIRILKSVSWNISTECKTDEIKINCYANNMFIFLINIYIVYVTVWISEKYSLLTCPHRRRRVRLCISPVRLGLYNETFGFSSFWMARIWTPTWKGCSNLDAGNTKIISSFQSS